MGRRPDDGLCDRNPISPGDRGICLLTASSSTAPNRVPIGGKNLPAMHHALDVCSTPRLPGSDYGAARGPGQKSSRRSPGSASRARATRPNKAGHGHIKFDPQKRSNTPIEYRDGSNRAKLSLTEITPAAVSESRLRAPMGAAPSVRLRHRAAVQKRRWITKQGSISATLCRLLALKAQAVSVGSRTTTSIETRDHAQLTALWTKRLPSSLGAVEALSPRS